MRKITAVLAVLLFSTLSVFSQQKVTGKVTDANGSPLAGISVKVKGTNVGTSTDANGSFSLDGKSDATLEFSGVGFESKSAKASASMSIGLARDTRSMSEVVVTGVGTATSKRKVAIDVATLSSKDVSKSVVGNVEQALVGKIAGANVQFLSGTPGSEPTILLRGLNTLSYAPPLIMVDGVEVSGLSGLDLATVDRVEVVKGAAGGMLYGAQGANGVIQIFTKKGGKGKKMEINVLSQTSMGQVITDKDIISKHHSFETDADGFITQGGVKIAPDETGSWPKGDFLTTGSNPDLKQDKSYKEQTYDHIKQAYRKAYTFNNSVNILGGGDKTDYSLTASQFSEQNVLSNKYNRTNISANLGFDLAKGLTLRNNLQTIFTDENLASGDADASIGASNTERFGIVTAFPFIDYLKRDATGHLVANPRSDDPGTLNPLSEKEWRDRSSKTFRVIENANLNYKFPRFVELDYKYGVEIKNTDDKSFYKNQESSLQAGIGYWGPTLKGAITNTYTNYKQQNSLATIFFKTDFEKDFNSKTPIKTVTQVSYDWRKYENRQYFAKGTELPAYPPYNIAVAATNSSSDYYDTFITFGTLFSQSIDYKDMLGVSGGFRSDFSSVFGSGKKAATFPRGALYFRPTEAWNLGGFITEWKLRGAYAEAGKQPKVYSNQNTLIVATLGTGSTLSTSSISANTGLNVERSKELEIGTDMIFKPSSKGAFQKIALSFSYWKRKTLGALQYQDLPLSSGFAKKLDNLSTIDAKGFDLSIDADVLSTRNLIWNFGYRMGTTKAIATKIAGGADIVQGIFTVRQGQELGLFSFQSPLSSLDQTRPDGSRYIDEADKGNYQVVNGNVVDKATKKAIMSDASDAKTVGSALPKFKASFINEFTIKQNLNVSFQWDWSYGGKIYNVTRQWLYRDRLSADYDKAITVDGQSGAYVNYYNALYNSVSPSTWFVENASYLRLRDVSISYDLKNALKLNWVKNLSVALSGRNLATITKYSGLDVEATTTSDAQGNEAKDGYSGALNGADYFAVPNLRSYQISLRVGF